jgi:Replication-relaxation
MLRAATALERLGGDHWRILDALAVDQLLATRQIEALCFSAGTPLSRARICRRRLRELTEWGLLHRERATPGQAGGGSRQASFALTSTGDRVLALRDGRTPRLRRPQDRGQAQTAHLLAVGAAHVVLHLACAKAGHSLRWVAEPACWRRVAAAGGSFTLRPDAYVEVTVGAERRLAWLEIDRGTQSVPVTIARKVRRYGAGALALAAVGAPIPRVLFVVFSAPRRERIAADIPTWAARAGVGEVAAGRLFAVAELAEAVDGLVA